MVTDLTPSEAYAMLREVPKGRLVDVRTTGEWAYVGGPDLAETTAETTRIEWHVWPDMTVNPDFTGMLDKAVGEDKPALFFLCRSGGRSLAAAKAAVEAGHDRVFNILHGFEGDLDDDGKRGQRNGWKANGLPWRQS